MKFSILTCLVLLLISACTSAPQKEWPAEIPPRHYFTEYYKKDPAHQKVTPEADYLRWIHRFYFGWELYRRGWLKVTNELMATLDDPADKLSAKEKMLEIGRVVSPEWAKERHHRVINTKHISIWGNALNESIVKGEQFVILDKVLADAHALLNRSLEPKDIRYDRYYQEQLFGEEDF